MKSQVTFTFSLIFLIIKLFAQQDCPYNSLDEPFGENIPPCIGNIVLSSGGYSLPCQNLSNNNLKLVFFDEFNETTLNLNKWATCWRGDNCNTEYGRTEGGDQVFLPENITVGNGKCKITAKRQDITYFGKTYKYTSGNISSTTFDWNGRFGKFEMRAKLPSGAGIGSAFWAWSPISELDIFEACGNNNSYNMTTHLLCGNEMKTCGKSLQIDNLFDVWHKFTVEWNYDKIVWKIDDIVKRTVYRQTHLETLTGVGCGEQLSFSNYFINKFCLRSETEDWKGAIVSLYVDENNSNNKWCPAIFNNFMSFPKEMEIDYVRIYQTNPREGTDLCAKLKINGADAFCNYTDTYTYTFDYANLSSSNPLLSWQVSPNLVLVSSNSTSCVVKRKTGTPEGTVEWVKVNFDTNIIPCTDGNIVKKIQVGKPSINYNYYTLVNGPVSNPSCFTHFDINTFSNTYAISVLRKNCFSTSSCPYTSYLPYNSYSNSSGGKTFQFNIPQSYDYLNTNNNCYQYKIRATNACGTTEITVPNSEWINPCYIDVNGSTLVVDNSDTFKISKEILDNSNYDKACNERIQANTTIDIIPNPIISDQFLIQINNMPLTNTRIEITDLNGKTNEFVTDSRGYINVPNYKNGIYFVMVKNNNTFITKKIIIQNVKK